MLVFAAFATSGGATEPPPLTTLKAPEKASTDKPPPSRPCVGDCVVPSKYRNYEGFLLWAGDDVRGVWSQVFKAAGLTFTPARQLILTGTAKYRTKCAVQPAVVRANSSVGPFWCSADRPGTVFIPATTTLALVFDFASDFRVRDYRERDFALSFVVAHEWGHHVQHELGITMPSIRQELQADCLAGIWAYAAWARSLLERGDISEAIRLAARIGDRPGVKPNDPSAHGTAAQRVQWFMRGFSSGRVARCDTSSVPVR